MFLQYLIPNNYDTHWFSLIFSLRKNMIHYWFQTNIKVPKYKNEFFHFPLLQFSNVCLENILDRDGWHKMEIFFKYLHIFHAKQKSDPLSLQIQFRNFKRNHFKPRNLCMPLRDMWVKNDKMYWFYLAKSTNFIG